MILCRVSYTRIYALGVLYQTKVVYPFRNTKSDTSNREVNINFYNVIIGFYKVCVTVFKMEINIKNLVSISEANQNFSKVARLVDENGAAIILKNNVPRYVIVEIGQFEKEETIENEEVNVIAKRFLLKHKEAFEELAK